MMKGGEVIDGVRVAPVNRNPKYKILSVQYMLSKMTKMYYNYSEKIVHIDSGFFALHTDCKFASNAF